MKVLVICAANPYDGTDNAWHGLRVARFSVDEGHSAKLFLIGDGVLLAHDTIPDTSGDLEMDKLLRKVTEKGIDTAACGTCLGMRKLDESGVKPGVDIGTMKMLINWLEWADKVVNF